jgi:hypothetical protein
VLTHKTTVNQLQQWLRGAGRSQWTDKQETCNTKTQGKGATAVAAETLTDN